MDVVQNGQASGLCSYYPATNARICYYEENFPFSLVKKNEIRVNLVGGVAREFCDVAAP